ncbi:hypothetical protein ACIO6U_15310 [Streptomyces sp. NPDC087422]|uniref:hypothetical protein n=1 Tax=Streptomyces sp. NPDC087422 TaxID=3365786 RepID=UPI0037F5160A
MRPGDSVARLSYPSATQTLLAAPNTDQAQPVASVPHTTYDLAERCLAVRALRQHRRRLHRRSGTGISWANLGQAVDETVNAHRSRVAEPLAAAGDRR